MAKLTLTDIQSGFVSTDALNANNALIETALENTLSRNGTAPNAMGADLDMNSNRIINLPIAYTNREAVPLEQLQSVLAAAASGMVANLKEEFIATEGQTLFTLLTYTYFPNSYQIKVFINGLLQDDGIAYIETSSSQVTFTAGLAAGDKVTIIAGAYL